MYLMPQKILGSMGNPDIWIPDISVVSIRCHKIVPWKPSNIIEPQEQPPKTAEFGLTIINYYNEW